MRTACRAQSLLMHMGYALRTAAQDKPRQRHLCLLPDFLGIQIHLPVHGQYCHLFRPTLTPQTAEHLQPVWTNLERQSIEGKEDGLSLATGPTDPLFSSPSVLITWEQNGTAKMKQAQHMGVVLPLQLQEILDHQEWGALNVAIGGTGAAYTLMLHSSSHPIHLPFHLEFQNAEMWYINLWWKGENVPIN